MVAAHVGYGWLRFVAAIAWPLVALVALASLVLALRAYGIPDSIRDVARRLKRVKVLQVEVELGEAVSKQAKETFEDAFKSYRTLVQSTMDHAVRKHGIDDKFRVAVDEIRTLAEVSTTQDNAACDYRYTLYVRDLLFDDGLYQLVDYFPQSTGRGRAFSTRFGIIGRAWRSEESLSQNVDSDPRKLVSEWGMTRQQALRAGSGRRSFAAIIVKDTGSIPRGLIFMDAKTENAFAPVETLETAVRDATARTGLSKALAVLAEETRGQGPEIQIYQDA